MGFSYRIYLITQDDRICRLAHARFDRMVRNPARHRLPEFAGQRVRMAGIVVEVTGRVPVGVVRRTFAILAFDRKGRIDVEQYRQQQFALAESALAPALTGGSDSDGTVVDAVSRFVAQGGVWTPSGHLVRTIDAVAMGRAPYHRL